MEIKSFDDCQTIVGDKSAVAQDQLNGYKGLLQTPSGGSLTQELVNQSINECESFQNVSKNLSGGTYDPPQLMCRTNGKIFTGLNDDTGVGSFCEITFDILFKQLPLFDPTPETDSKMSAGSTPGVTLMPSESQRATPEVMSIPWKYVIPVTFVIFTLALFWFLKNRK